jgi:membrane protease YdiL (CAAX protease family)
MSDFPLPEPAANKTVRTDQALDIQHDTDPAQDHGNARRIPHLGHALFFFSLVITFVLMAQVVVLFAFHAFTPATAMQHAFALFTGMMIAYAVTFAIAIPVMPLFWHRSFFDGIHWTWRQAQLNGWKLLLLGVALSATAQLLGQLFKTPATSDVRFLLNTPLHAWLTALFGSLFVPAVEEIGFRGFLLPALATAYDWLSLDRTPAAHDRWLRTTNNTRGSLIFAAIFSSIAFASLHGSQLHWAAGPLAVLLLMSLAFCAVRIYTRSVAASTLVHIAYDALIFIEVIIATGGFRHLDKI